jgi:hypothetical protein
MAWGVLVESFWIGWWAYLSGGKCARVSCVDDGDNELADTARGHSSHEKDSATAIFGDDATVDDDDDDSNGSQDAGVHEWRPDFSHGEEVRSVCYEVLATYSEKIGKVIIQIIYIAPEAA